MRQIAKFLRLSSAERKLFIRAMLFLWAVRCGLWILPYERLYRFLFRKRHATENLRIDHARVALIVRSVKSTSRYVPSATCLTQALVALRLLDEAGQMARLRIGVARSDRGKLEAHAWVECQGHVIIGGNHAELSRYTVLQAIEGT